MKTQLYLSDFVNDSQYSADIIVGSKRLLAGIQHLLGNIALNIVLAILFIPSTLLLRYLCHRLAVKIPGTLHIENAKDYVYMREAYDKLSHLLQILTPIQSINRNNTPFVLRITLKEMDKMIGIMQQFTNVLKKAIADLDTLDDVNSQSLFKQIPESEIWNAHVPAYEYRL